MGSAAVKHAFAVVVGYLIACLCFEILVQLFILLMDQLSGLNKSGFEITAVFANEVFFTSAKFALFMATPTLAVVAIVELKGMRNLGTTLAAGFLISAIGLATSAGKGVWPVFLVGGAIGLVPAYLYWLIAGRYAGLWRDAKAGNQH